MSSDFACESRRGRLIVVEGAAAGGGSSSYDHDYALCWHAPSTQDYTIPDPEESWVPRWPGSDTAAMCRGCEIRGDRCESAARRHTEVCVERHEAHYRKYCRNTYREYRRPLNRRGEKMKVSGYCASLLDWDQGRGDLVRMGEEWSGKARRERQRCEGNVLAECLADFERSHPNENVENRLVLQIKDFFQVGFSRTLLWGGTVGFRQACQEAGTMVIGECVSEQVSCERKADPTNICMQSEENRP